MNIWDKSIRKTQGFQLEHEYFKVKVYKTSGIQQIVQEKKGLYSKKKQKLYENQDFFPSCS